MSDKDLTHLIERLCNPGADLSVAAFEAAEELFYQAAEIERLRGIVPEVLERLNRELCQENEALQQSLAECVEDSEELLANYLQAYGDRYRVDRMNHMREQIRRARALLPDPELEWLTGCPECGMDAGCDCYSGTENEPEPAAPTVVEPDDMEGTAHKELGPPRPLYRNPPRTALTVEQIDEIAATNLGDYEEGKWHLVFARAIERAHGITSEEPQHG